jgi:hypothetical protein
VRTQQSKALNKYGVLFRHCPSVAERVWPWGRLSSAAPLAEPSLFKGESSGSIDGPPGCHIASGTFRLRDREWTGKPIDVELSVGESVSWDPEGKARGVAATVE